MELAGLEPATSWVRSSRPLTLKAPGLQRFIGERLECRNISRNSLHRVLQRHEVLDRSADAIPSFSADSRRTWPRTLALPNAPSHTPSNPCGRRV
jgi:hypothetical protein